MILSSIYTLLMVHYLQHWQQISGCETSQEESPSLLSTVSSSVSYSEQFTVTTFFWRIVGAPSPHISAVLPVTSQDVEGVGDRVEAGGDGGRQPGL